MSRTTGAEFVLVIGQVRSDDYAHVRFFAICRGYRPTVKRINAAVWNEQCAQFIDEISKIGQDSNDNTREIDLLDVLHLPAVKRAKITAIIAACTDTDSRTKGEYTIARDKLRRSLTSQLGITEDKTLVGVVVGEDAFINGEIALALLEAFDGDLNEDDIGLVDRQVGQVELYCNP